ncbi:hypothetical protein ACFL2O_00785 [Thermodesulfobacteriota bacterium]
MLHTTNTASLKSVFDSIKLSDIPGIQKDILRKPTNTRPAVRIVEKEGVRAIVKDFSPTGFLFRNTAGRFLIWREMKAYHLLDGTMGTPALVKVVEGLALVIEEIPGRNLEKLERTMILPEKFFHDFKKLVYRFHKRGLAHCDLKRAPNTLIGNNSKPYVIDWGASISRGEFRFYPLNRIYRRFLLDDYNAIVKLKLRHVPDAVTAMEMARYKYRSRSEKIVRAVRDRLRKVLKKVA